MSDRSRSSSQAYIASHHPLCLQRNGWVPPPILPAGYLGWILATLRVSDEVFYESAGLDALMQVGASCCKP